MLMKLLFCCVYRPITIYSIFTTSALLSARCYMSVKKTNNLRGNKCILGILLNFAMINGHLFIKSTYILYIEKVHLNIYMAIYY